jgi:hypothetical protein
MVKAKLFGGSGLFQCGFCPLNSYTYLGALSHELETHVRQINCSCCADPLAEFLEHYQSCHDDKDGRRDRPTSSEGDVATDGRRRTKSSVVLALPVTPETAGLVTSSVNPDR